jgi:hypothetical protein
MRTTIQRAAVAGMIAVAAALVAGAVFAADWVFLGERVVNDRIDHDTIVVTGAEGQFSAVQVRVRRRPVHFLDMKIHYANDTTQDVALRAVIPAGGQSRVIDLIGSERMIRRVDFTYEAKSIGRGKKALIRLWGRR